jgi:hypothetical protein
MDERHCDNSGVRHFPIDGAKVKAV